MSPLRTETCRIRATFSINPKLYHSIGQEKRNGQVSSTSQLLLSAMHHCHTASAFLFAVFTLAILHEGCMDYVLYIDERPRDNLGSHRIMLSVMEQLRSSDKPLHLWSLQKISMSPE